MSEFKNIDEARAFFAGDLFSASNGITIDELGENWCVCSMEIAENHRNAAGGVMGGVIFTLGDFAFAVAANNVHKTTVAQSVSINFLSGSRGSRLIARAKCKKDGKNTCVYNIDITDDLGRDIAQVINTGYKL
ncbi:MAG: PaaI family thioesterase [Oscillospiraceae bacterium]|nr:PaaI family thioesterase [Oscillospiraceae bacterium]